MNRHHDPKTGKFCKAPQLSHTGEMQLPGRLSAFGVFIPHPPKSLLLRPRVRASRRSGIAFQIHRRPWFAAVSPTGWFLLAIATGLAIACSLITAGGVWPV